MLHSKLTFTTCFVLLVSIYSILPAQEFRREVDTIPVIVDGVPIHSPFAGGLPGNSAPTFADIDGDGDFDLFLGNHDGNIHFYRNTGTTTDPDFRLETKNFFDIDIGTESAPAFADIDGDGDLDLFVGKYISNIHFYRNTGTAIEPIFTLETENFADIVVGRFSTPTFADIDDDGDLDLFVGENGGNINFYRNTGTAIDPILTLETENFADIDAGSHSAPTFVDIDNDSDLDLFVGKTEGNINFYRNTGTGTIPNFTLETETFVDNYVGFNSIPNLVDIDHDNDLDLFLGGRDGYIHFYRNTGTGTNQAFKFITQNFISINVGSNSTPTIADIDNDGDFDLFIGEEDGNINFFRNTGTAIDPIFTLETENFADIDIGPSSALAPTFADIDNDGDFDLFIGEQDGNINFYRNTGTAIEPIFTLETENFADIDVGRFSTPTFADIDDDGDFDLFVGERQMNFYRNTGTSTTPIFTLVTKNFVTSYGSPTFADIDNDGDLDLFVGGYYGNINFYRNAGTVTDPNFILETRNFADIDVGSFSTPTFTDIDNDGDLDLLIGYGGGLYFYRAFPGPDIRISPTSLSFGNVNVDSTKDQNLTIFNDGSETLVISNITSDNPTFSLVGTTCFDITPGSSNNVTVRFSPNISGQHTGNIAIYSNVPDPGRKTITVSVSGDGVIASDLTMFRHEIDTVPVINGVPIHTPFAGGFRSSKPTLADLDNDGDFDIFVGDEGGNISFFHNAGTPTNYDFNFETRNFSNIDVGSFSTPTFVDIDDDSDLDLFVGEGDGNINFFRNNGTATAPDFILETEFFAGIEIRNSAPAFADIDSDGDFDLFVGNGEVTFYRNTGTATNPAFTLESDTFIDIAGYFPTFADLDNDGDLDLFVGDRYGTIIYYKNTGSATNPTFILETESFANINVTINTAPTFADIDDDGDLDLLVGNGGDFGSATSVQSGGNLSFYRNTGTATELNFTIETKNFLSIDIGILTTPALADIDNDGDLDLFIGNGGSYINFYRNIGTATNPTLALVTGSFLASGRFSAPTFVDIDNDGDLDLFVGHGPEPTFGGGGRIIFYRNIGTLTIPNFALVTSFFASIKLGDFNLAIPTFADIDNDGDLDLFVGERNGNIHFYRNTGTATAPDFTLATDTFENIDIGSWSGPTFTDIDNDGDLDLFVGEEGGNINFYLNTGRATAPDFTLATEAFENIDIGSRSTPTFADIDNDGDSDLFVGESNGGLHFYRNIIPIAVVRGDVNNDGTVDITDLLLVIDIILRRVSPTPDLIARADVNEDGKVSIGDVVAIVKIILNNQASVVLASKDKALTSAEISLQDIQAGETHLSNLSLTVKLDAAASAAVFLFNYDGNSLSVAEPVSSKNGSGLNLISGSNDNKLIAVIYGINDNLITAGESNLLSLPVTVKENGIENGLSLESAQFIGVDGEIIEIASKIASSPQLPKTFGLSQNYPNPFNPSTTINYEIPETKSTELDVKLYVYNIRGQLIKKLVNEKKMPGYYSVHWDGLDARGRTVSSGIYYYMIVAGNYKEMKKMLMVK